MFDKDYCLKILAGAEYYFMHSLSKFDKSTKRELSFDDVDTFQKGFLSGVTAACAFLTSDKVQGGSGEKETSDEDFLADKENVN